MKKWIFVFLFFGTAASASIFINSFNSGQLSKDLKVRVDLERHTMGSETLTNILIRPQGMAYKRPGTEYITSRIADINIPGTPAVSEYPTLRETTDSADLGLTETLAIVSVTDLQNMSLNLAGNYYLTGNIDASATSTWNGGAGFDPIEEFTGSLDGNSYNITGLFINRPTELKIGLFGKILGGTQIANVNLVNCNISGQQLVGVVAAYILASAGEAIVNIRNCTVSGSVAQTGTESYGTGALVGMTSIANTSGGVNITDCDSSATVTGNAGTYIGGLIGMAWADGPALKLTIAHCSATGNVVGNSANYCGGFAGNIYNYTTVTDSYATGNVSGAQWCGGFAGGILYYNTIDRCYSTGDVTGTGSPTGGFTGSADLSTAITDCYAWGNIVGGGAVAGGFSGAGGGIGGSTITNCYSIGTVTGAITNGGLVGSGSNITSTSCYWDTEASGVPTSAEGTGQTTAEMKTEATYIGWDFDTIWYMANTPGTPDQYWSFNHGAGDPVRLIPFEHSVSDAYVIEMGHRYLSFLRTTP